MIRMILFHSTGWYKCLHHGITLTSRTDFGPITKSNQSSSNASKIFFKFIKETIWSFHSSHLLDSLSFTVNSGRLITYPLFVETHSSLGRMFKATLKAQPPTGLWVTTLKSTRKELKVSLQSSRNKELKSKLRKVTLTAGLKRMLSTLITSRNREANPCVRAR